MNIDLLSDTAEQLPEDWEIRILIRHGTLDAVLVDPDGNMVEIDDDVLNQQPPFRDKLAGPITDELLVDMIRYRVNYARDADGLNPIGTWDEV